jgi:sec-independent protein translocase protein TatB
MLELQSPRERCAIESMEERDETTGPVDAGHVDAVDARRCQPSSATFRPLTKVGEARGVDQTNIPVNRTKWLEHRQRWAAQPQPWHEVECNLPYHRNDGWPDDQATFEIERQVIGVAACVDDFCQRGNVRRELATSEFADGPPLHTPHTGQAVVIAHHLAVCGEPHIAFQAGSAEFERKGKRRNRVLGCVRLRTTMREQDRRVDQRRKELLHATSAWHDHTDAPRFRRLPCVFNLQGGELMIILLLALVVLGPEKLPEAMRKLGKMYGELKRMSSGFQEEFRSAVDEPMREFRKAVDEPMNELRGTANALRDSADFRRFEAGERTEKPKSGDMATVTESAALLTPADPEAVPVAETPSFEPADGSDPDPGPMDGPAFDQQSAEAFGAADDVDRERPGASE